MSRIIGLIAFVLALTLSDARAQTIRLSPEIVDGGVSQSGLIFTSFTRSFSFGVINTGSTSVSFSLTGVVPVVNVGSLSSDPGSSCLAAGTLQPGQSAVCTLLVLTQTEGPFQVGIVANSSAGPSNQITLRGIGCDFSNSAGDCDGDGIPNGLESAENLKLDIKDNDIFANPRLFSKQTYRDFLLREADNEGFLFWASSIARSERTRTQMIDGFLNSGEFDEKVAPIARLFLATYNRRADFAGLNFWATTFKNGRSFDAIATTFSEAPEFVSRYGQLDNRQYVERLFQNIFGRADAAGTTFWTAELNALPVRLTRGQLLARFAESNEFKQRSQAEVKVLLSYAAMLKRDADDGGYNFWVGQVRGGVSITGLIDGFIGSQEYRKRFLP